MTRLEQLYTKMVDTAPVFITESNKAYILKLARDYARECCKASLEKAADNTTMKHHCGTTKLDTFPKYFQNGADNLTVNKQSICNPENIILP